MQPITDELASILKAKFQSGADGFRARFVIDDPEIPPPPPAPVSVVQWAFCNGPQIGSAELANEATPGNTLVAMQFCRDMTGGTPPNEPGLPNGFTRIEWTYHTQHFKRGLTMDYHVVTDHEEDYTAPILGNPYYPAGDRLTYLATNSGHRYLVIEIEGEYADVGEKRVDVPSTSTNNTGGPIVPPAEDVLLIGASAGDNGMTTTPLSDEDELVDVLYGGFAPYCWCGFRNVTGDGATPFTVGVTQSPAKPFAGIVAAFRAIAPTGGEGGGGSTSRQYKPKRVAIDKSLRVVADTAEVEFPNEDLPLGWGPSSVFPTNAQCRIFQWYGDDPNAVQVFTGIVDGVKDHRDVLTTTIACRDRMAILVDQTFSASAPQQADEPGAVRTTTNGVYLSMEVSAIVDDILDRAGWPEADRAVMPTSYVLDEFIVSDGATWAATIIGDEKLTGLVGYSAWADEFGVFHFAPTLVSQTFTDPDDPVYTFRSSEDVLDLDDETDQYELRTRVKVRGPLTTTTLQDTWREVWRTRKFAKPVGLWHDPADAANLRVLDRGTKRLYKLRQSDRAILSSVNVQPICAHPLGLSGDPADASVYWLLNAPWIDGSSGTNRVKKVRKSDNVVLASFALPAGNWSALKVSSSFLWLTNLSTDRFYKRSKTDGSAIDSYQHTYGGNLQANPSGMMLNGTTLYVFWSNGGSTARFLICDEAAPGTVTGVVKTAGTVLHGGEFDTVTDVDCYGDSDSLGLVAKFTLKTAVSSTAEVFAEVVDVELEDELGALAHLEPRVHDAHSGDDPHSYEVRRMTLDLRLITSLAQATETAQRQLDLASVRRRVLDVGIIGNPAIQKGDLVGVVDPIAGISTSFVVDTYRSLMTGGGTFLGTLALLPVEDIADDPTDEGDASE